MNGFGKAGEQFDSALLDEVREHLVLAEGRADLSSPGPGRSGAFSVSAALGRSGRLLGSQGLLEAAEDISAHVHGLGPLQHLLEDEAVTDILVNGPFDVWADAGRGLEKASPRFASEEEVRALAQRLVTAGGKRLDDACPAADVKVGLCRVHAILPPLSGSGTLLSIRVARERAFGLAGFCPAANDGSTTAMHQILEAVVRKRANFLVSGSTGSGKTSLIAALLGQVSAGERIIVAEDTAELAPEHPHTVSLQTRLANADGAGEVTLSDLLRQAMRMRPDRIVVGECRGAEVRELLSAMNTGHSGSAGTVHANRVQAVPARLIAMGALAGMAPEATALQIRSAVEVFIHVERSAGGRAVSEVGVIDKAREGAVVVSAVRQGSGGTLVPGPGWRSLYLLLGLEPEALREELALGEAGGGDFA